MEGQSRRETDYRTLPFLPGDSYLGFLKLGL